MVSHLVDPMKRLLLSFCILHSAFCIPLLALCIVHSAFCIAAASPYGACAHLPRDEFAQREGILSLMRVAGIANVRCDLDWAAWEKDNAYPRFAAVLDAAERAGVAVLPILGGSSPRRVLPFEEHQDEFIAAFRPYVADVMRRFGARLPAFEVWNEPNLPGWWNLPNPTNYLAVLKAAHDEIKAANPDALVCLGGVSDVGLGYIRALYELGAAPYFDVVCCHPYTIPFAPEGSLDVKLGKLRALMAEFGDDKKPIWITEVGFPTHKNGIGTVETQVLLSGLRLARPEQRSWRVACASIAPEGKTPPQDFAGELLAVLPQGSTALCCAPDELREKLAADAFDAVVFPMDSEGYPADAVEAVTDFVRRGGVLVETGGAPLYFPYLCDAGGNVAEDKTRDPAADRRSLRLGFSAWWLDPDLPTRTEVFATPRALEAGFKQHPAGYGGTRFLTPEFLRPGDEFIPILAGKSKSGKEIVSAAVIRFGSDFKGALVVSGQQKGYGPVAHSERQQALYLARSILVALAEGVEKFYAYELRATEHDPYYSESHFGIVHRNLSPKPAYSAYATLTDRRPAGSVQLPGPWRDKAQKLYFPQWTSPDGTAAGAIWTTGESRKLEIEFDTDAMTFMDAFGLPIPPRRTASNRFVLDLSDAPIYFTGGRLMPCEGAGEADGR